MSITMGVTTLALFPRALVLVAALALPISAAADDHEGDATSASPTTISAIGPDSARVSGAVRAGTRATAYWFEYGTSPTYGHQTPPAQAGGESGQNTTVSALLTELPSAAVHHVRLVAASGKSRSLGRDATFTTAAAPVAPPTPAVPAAPTPVPALGQSVVTSAVAGGPIRVRPRGSAAYHVLTIAESIPVGSVVDARRGTVELRTARKTAGAVQAGRFGGGRFLVRQRRGSGMTSLHLRGGSFAGCRTGHGLARAAAERPRRVRRIWGSDHHGRFRTYGRDSVATVRGTRWSVTDRCDGTLTRVSAGGVDVRRFRDGRVVRVRAGHRHLARHRP
jgi:hypothetical protein